MSVYTLKTLHCLKWFNFTSQLTCPWLFSINTCQFIFVYELKTDPTKNNIPGMQTLTLKIKKRQRSGRQAKNEPPVPLTLALAYPNLMVMFLSSSFLNLTVWTPEMAFTTVDFPWATWPMVPGGEERNTAVRTHSLHESTPTIKEGCCETKWSILVPILMVACLLMISWERGVRVDTSCHENNTH